jgi:hypothetical protein
MVCDTTSGLKVNARSGKEGSAEPTTAYSEYVKEGQQVLTPPVEVVSFNAEVV